MGNRPVGRAQFGHLERPAVRFHERLQKAASKAGQGSDYIRNRFAEMRTSGLGAAELDLLLAAAGYCYRFENDARRKRVRKTEWESLYGIQLRGLAAKVGDLAGKLRKLEISPLGSTTSWELRVRRQSGSELDFRLKRLALPDGGLRSIRDLPDSLDALARFVRLECEGQDGMSNPKRAKPSVAAEKTVLEFRDKYGPGSDIQTVSFLLGLVFEIAVPKEVRAKGVRSQPSFEARHLLRRTERSAMPPLASGEVLRFGEGFLLSLRP